MSRLVLSEERYEEIKESVVGMFEEYNTSRIPINGFEISNRMGVDVIPYSLFDHHIRSLMKKESKDGFTKLDCGRFTIYYNDKKDKGRISNTIMHEIGHIVLGHLEESSLAEAEARFFAKYALVPPALVHKYNLSCPTEIKKKFNVSIEASRYAYDYYQKWLIHGKNEYTDYEVRTLNLFK